MRALIICHGDPPSEALLRRQTEAADLILCTDGVAPWARDAGVPVSFVIGDMDSLRDREVGFPLVDAGPHDQQNSSDSEKAILFALERRAERIVLVGATGGRLDHTLANVGLAAKYADRAEVVLADDLGELRVLRGRHELALPAGATVSLLPLTEDAVVRTWGLQWELAGPLEPGTRGVSNRALGGHAVIEVSAGTVALVVLNSTR